MDTDLLRSKGAQPVNIRSASVLGFALRIEKRATLFRKPGSRCHGALMVPCRDRATVYAVKLRALAQRLGLPDDYVSSIK